MLKHTMIHEIRAMAAVVPVHLILDSLHLLPGTTEHQTHVANGSKDITRVEPALLQAGVPVVAHDRVCAGSIHVVWQWRCGTRIAGDRVRLVRCTTLASAEDDGLVQSFGLKGAPETPLQSLVCFGVDGMVATDKCLRTKLEPDICFPVSVDFSRIDMRMERTISIHHQHELFVLGLIQSL